MRRIVLAFSLIAAVGSIEGCNCGNQGGGGDGGDGFTGNEDLSGFIEDMTGLDLFQTDGIIITLPDGGTTICFKAYCQGKLWQCGDCMDNDGDGLIDSFDPNCLGACQNNETGFTGNIPGQNNAPCKADCYWDQDTGSGNDQCYWDHECDPFEANPPPAMTSPEIGCKYDPNTKVAGANVPPGEKDCMYLLNNQRPECTNFCKPLTPNGCDCFGCCENPKMPGTYIYAGSEDANDVGTCNINTLTDPTKCKACTPVVGCSKACGRCQLCFGKTIADLPADCFQQDGGVPDAMLPPPIEQCPGGEQPCGLPGQAPCGPGYYCVTGCCQLLIP